MVYASHIRAISVNIHTSLSYVGNMLSHVKYEMSLSMTPKRVHMFVSGKSAGGGWCRPQRRRRRRRDNASVARATCVAYCRVVLNQISRRHLPPHRRRRHTSAPTHTSVWKLEDWEVRATTTTMTTTTSAAATLEHGSASIPCQVMCVANRTAERATFRVLWKLYTFVVVVAAALVIAEYFSSTRIGTQQNAHRTACRIKHTRSYTHHFISHPLHFTSLGRTRALASLSLSAMVVRRIAPFANQKSPKTERFNIVIYITMRVTEAWLKYAATLNIRNNLIYRKQYRICADVWYISAYSAEHHSFHIWAINFKMQFHRFELQIFTFTSLSLSISRYMTSPAAAAEFNIKFYNDI